MIPALGAVLLNFSQRFFLGGAEQKEDESGPRVSGKGNDAIVAGTSR